MKRDHTICPNCGSGDVELLLRPAIDPAIEDVFATIPPANRRCHVCGVRWEVEDAFGLTG